jgi:diaminopimelate decarboxylase
MAGFSRDSQGRAWFGGCLITELLSHPELTTPAYWYDLDGIGAEADELVAALGPGGLVAYAVKANSAASILRVLKDRGVGADVVSGGELRLVLQVGVAPDRIVISGVAKATSEIDLAISAGIRAIQIESPEEVLRVAARAQALGTRARVALRINPSVAIDAHAHVATGHDKAKFGIPLANAAEAFALVDQSDSLDLVGISTHVGSTLMTPEPYVSAARVVCELAIARRAQGKAVEYLDFGGGFGIDYGRGKPERPAAFAQAARTLQREQNLLDHRLVVEPGRCLVGAYGALVCRVVQPKITAAARWLLIDGAMNDLLRPALYQAHHRIEAPDTPPAGEPFRIVGPVCESADDFGSHVVSKQAPSHVVIRDAGAYGYTMASNYNGRPLPQEVFLAGGAVLHHSPRPDADGWLRSRLDA